MTLFEFARAAGVTSARIRVYLAEGRLPGAVKKADGKWAIPSTALTAVRQFRAFVEQQQEARARR